MSTAKRIAVNSVYQLVGKFIVLAVSLAMVAILARKLGVANYGIYTVAMTYSQLYSILGDLGISIYLLKKLSAAVQFGTSEQELLGGVTEVRVITAVLGSLAALAITYVLPYGSVQRQTIAVAILAVIVQMVNGLYVTVLQSKLEMRFASVSEVLGRITMFIGVVIALHYNLGIVSVLAAQIVGNTVNLAMTYWLSTTRFLKPKYTFNAKEWVYVVKASALIGISSILSYVYFKTDSFLLSILHIPGKSNLIEVGLYGASYKVIEVLIIIPGVFLGTIFPLFTGALARQDHTVAHLLTNRSFQVMLGVSSAACMTLVLFSHQVIHFIAGPNFAPAAIPLQILALAIPFNFVGSVFTYALLGLEQQKLLTYLYGGAAVFNIVSNMILIPRYSYIAAAWTTVATEIIVTFGSFLLLRYIYPIKLEVGEAAAIIGSILFAGVISYLIPDTLMAWRISAYTIVLLVVVAIFYKRLMTVFR